MKETINLIRYIYKCINYRKEEEFRAANKLKRFCSATIIYIPSILIVEGRINTLYCKIREFNR